MKSVKMLWIPVLLGTLLMATFAGVAGARPNARPEASPALVDYMFTAHHCIPSYNLGTVRHDFLNDSLRCLTATCSFACPIKPPHEGLIRVQRIAMYAYDNGALDVCIDVRHVYPKTGLCITRLAWQCTANSANDPEVLAMNPANFKVSVLQDLYVWVKFNGTTQKLYGFKVKYEPL